MKTVKKFALITLLPVVLIALISIMISQSLEDVGSFRINFMLLGYFAIISFSYVYIFENQKSSNKTLITTYIDSIVILSILLFIFCAATFHYLFEGFKLTIAVFQTILGICIFLTIAFALEIYKQSAHKNVLTVIEKPFYFVKLILRVSIVLSIILFVLTSDSYLDNFVSQPITDIITTIMLFNLTVTVVSFATLAALYNILYLRKKIILGTSVAAFISGILILYLNHFLNRNVYIGYPQLFFMCFFCCFLITVQVVYRNKIQNLSLSILKKETECLQLKNQVNPHFLFNNLNTLIAFIEINPQKAIVFGHQLSNVYRHYLKNENDDFVLLADELEFISEYMAIFKAKFDSGFDFNLENQATPQQYILSFSLQELMDNIFKHTILDVENPISIIISISTNELLVKNTNHKKVVQNSSKKGLQNINKRYQLLTQKEITIKENTKFFEVRIPILNVTK